MWTKIKDNWNLIVIILIICGVFLWGKSCGNKVIEPIEPKVITITNYRDTIFPVDTFYSHTIIPGKPRIIHDTVPVYYLDSASCNRYYVYDDTIKDSKYDVISRQVVQGRLSSSNIKVKLKVPLIIKDSIVVKMDSLIYRPYKYEIHAGGVVGFRTLTPVVEMSINKATYGAGYDILNKSIIFTAKYRLFGWTPKNK
jgi:hypothetical protein